MTRPDDASLPRRAPDPGRAPSSPGADPISLLVVEDNASDRWYFSEILRERGFRVTSCQDAERALELVERERPPIVLLDLMLPGMDGAQLCRRIRTLPGGEDCVVVVVTGRTDRHALAEVLKAGADDFIRKPVDPGLLDTRLAIARRWVREHEDRRATQRELAETTLELETLFRNLPDVFFSVDLRAERLIQISPAAAPILGHGPEELKGRPGRWRELLFPADADGQGLWDQIISGAVTGPVVREHTIQDLERGRRHLRLNLWVQDRDGAPHRADGVVSDVTDQRRTTEELVRRNKELAALNRIAEISLRSGSATGAMEGILAEVAELLDVPVAAIEELIQDEASLVVRGTHGVPRPVGPEAELALHRSLARHPVQDGLLLEEHDRRIIRDEGPRYLEGTETGTLLMAPLSVGTRVTGVLVLAWPERRELGAEERHLVATLANAVAAHVERHQTEEALRANETRYRALVDELQQANAELESFAYSISHDLRAPLRTMQGFAHALVQNFGHDLGDEARDYARRIIASGKQSEELISDLLEYSRLSFGELETQPVELGPVVDAALDQVRADVEAAGARIRVEEPLPTVVGNRTLLIQVVSNLLGNAVKFVPDDRTPRVRVRAEEVGGEVRLWVEDNGIGVPAEHSERIFKVFERLSATGERPGTGIGLAIVRRGVQRLSGRCGVEASDEGGAAFWIQLRRRPDSGWRPWAKRP